MSDTAARVERLQALIAEHELDALIVSNLFNVRWLAGFSGTNGACLVTTSGDPVLVTDFRYTELAAEQAPEFELVKAERELLGAVVERLSGRVGFDDRHLTVKAHARLTELLEESGGEGVELVAAGGLVEKPRAVKEPEEVAAIRAAAAVGEELYAGIRDQGLAGRTEIEVARWIEAEARARGAEPSFPPIVATRENGARPHAEPRDAGIGTGELVVIDLGCKLDDYCSDCTRTFASGPVEGDALEVYELVRSAQAAALEAAVDGAVLRDVDAVARTLIEEAGHGDEFGHSLGHGVGLEVHEEPRLAATAEEGEALAAGMVVTVEPGVYVAGEFGVRIEDLVVVGDEGNEVLTPFPKDLTVAGT